MKNKCLGLELKPHSNRECGVTPIARLFGVWHVYTAVFHVFIKNELFYYFYFNYYRTLLWWIKIALCFHLIMSFYLCIKYPCHFLINKQHEKQYDAVLMRSWT